MIADADFDCQALVDYASALINLLNIVVRLFRNDVLHENGISHWEQALWHKLLLSEVPQSAAFNFFQVSPVNVSWVWKLNLLWFFPLFKSHVSDDSLGFTISAQLSKLLSFVLSTEKFVVVDWWQVLLKVHHLFSDFFNSPIISFNVLLELIPIILFLWSLEIILSSSLVPVEFIDLTLQFIDFCSDFHGVPLSNELISFFLFFVTRLLVSFLDWLIDWKINVHLVFD